MTVERVKNILIVGVGGQGVILASDILTDVALACGFDAKKSEIHGMSQRGGVVSSNVRYGSKVYSPMIAQGEVDLLISSEAAEAVRWFDHLAPNGRLISSTQKLVPPMVSAGTAQYPDNYQEMIKAKLPSAIFVDAVELANQLGNPRLVNTILLGIASRILDDLKPEVFLEVLAERVPPKFKDLNLEAFNKGRSISA